MRNFLPAFVAVITFFILLFTTCTTATAQPEPCGTMAVMELSKQINPTLTAQRNAWERQIQDYLLNHSRDFENEVITIPTVVHIIYHTDEENLPDSIVYNQMNVLNEDFRRLNADTVNTPDYFKPVAADMRFEFCLATHDPAGNPTTGITRTYTNVEQFAYNSGNYEVITRMHFDSKGGKNIWNRNEYMNIWVINLNNSSGVLAFAYLPGADPAVDGIVCDYEYFGKPAYGLGRTMTHEVGHWLNLYHPFNDSDGAFCSDDFVEDTPPQEEANFTCYDFPHSTCGNYSDMYMNYMDYPGDDCVNMFTLGQTARAHAAVHIMRPALLTATTCQPIANNDVKLVTIDEPGANYCFSNIVPLLVTIKNNGNNTINSVKIGYAIDGETAAEVTDWGGTLLPGETASGILAGLPDMTPGTHQLKIFTYLPNNFPDSYTQSDTIAKMVTAGAGLPAPYTETFNNPYPQNGWSIYDEANAVPWQQIDEVVCADGSIGSIMAVKNDFSDYFEVEGTIDDLYSPNIDLTNFSDAQLTFDVSYWYNNDLADELSVLASPYCSPPYEQLYLKAGAELDTRNTPSPQTAADWRTETIDLTPYAGQSVMLVFRNKTAGGNWLMIDNINITGTQFPVGTPALAGNSNPTAHLCPNPAQNNWWAQIYNPYPAQTAHITVMSLQGQLLFTQTATIQTGQNKLPIQADRLTPGIYLIQINTNSQTWALKGVK